MSGIYIKDGSSLRNILIYKKNSNGMEICPVYKKTLNGMERIDSSKVINSGSGEGEGETPSPELPTVTTEVIKGYADWCGSYRSTSTSGTFTDNFNDDRRDRIYQGTYSSSNYIGIINFKKIFQEVKDLNGTIKSIKLKLTNLHSYYYAGLNTYICGASNLTSTRPTSFSSSNVDETKLSDKINFSKGGTLTINLNDTAIERITNGDIDGFRLLSPTGYTITDYGYFSGVGTNRPYIEITIEY